jgi:hypothetical protein
MVESSSNSEIKAMIKAKNAVLMRGRPLKVKVMMKKKVTKAPRVTVSIDDIVFASTALKKDNLLVKYYK